MDTAVSAALAEVDAAGLAAALAAPGPLLLVDYVADHCVWCTRLEPVLLAVEPQFRNRVRMLKVNVSRHPDALPAQGLRGTPTVMLYREGRLLMARNGMMQRAALVAFLEHWLNPSNEGL